MSTKPQPRFSPECKAEFEAARAAVTELEQRAARLLAAGDIFGYDDAKWKLISARLRLKDAMAWLKDEYENGWTA